MQKVYHRSILISGVIIMLMGLAHTAMAPAMYEQAMKVEVMRDKAAGLIYFFALTGIAFFFAGFVITYASKGVKIGEKWGKVLVTYSSIFILVSGLSAIFLAGFGNPLVYIMTICPVVNLIILYFFLKTAKPKAF